MSNIHLLRDTTLRDIPATLRALADEVEGGKFGKAESCVVVIDAEYALEVSFCGSGEAAPNAHLLLHAGAAKMMHAVISEKCA